MCWRGGTHPHLLPLSTANQSCCVKKQPGISGTEWDGSHKYVIARIQMCDIRDFERGFNWLLIVSNRVHGPEIARMGKVCFGIVASESDQVLPMREIVDNG